MFQFLKHLHNIIKKKGEQIIHNKHQKELEKKDRYRERERKKEDKLGMKKKTNDFLLQFVPFKYDFQTENRKIKKNNFIS